MDKKEFVIENWHIIRYYDNKLIIRGNVYKHDKFKDGEYIRSSAIVKILENNQIETLNTIYKLGEKSKDQIDGQLSLEYVKEILNK